MKLAGPALSALTCAVLACAALNGAARAQDTWGDLARFAWFACDCQDRVGDTDVGEGFKGAGLPQGWSAPGSAAEPAWRIADGHLALARSRQPLSGAGDPALVGRVLPSGAFSASTLVDYRALDNGDVAGLAAWRDAGNWLSIQVERIEPADLVAVRWRNGIGGPLAGKLIATTALPAAAKGQVRLRIDGDGHDTYRLLFATLEGNWQVLSADLDGSMLSGANSDQLPRALIGPFAVDGAERN